LKEYCKKLSVNSNFNRGAEPVPAISYIKKNHKVTILGFGTFKNVYRKTRMGRNPQTGKTMKTKGKNVVIFKASKNLP
jgi:nucleoid DNA-binding protein